MKNNNNSTFLENVTALLVVGVVLAIAYFIF